MFRWRREVRIKKGISRWQGETWYYGPCGKRMKQFPEVIKVKWTVQKGSVVTGNWRNSVTSPVAFSSCIRLEVVLDNCLTKVILAFSTPETIPVSFSAKGQGNAVLYCSISFCPEAAKIQLVAVATKIPVYSIWCGAGGILDLCGRETSVSSECLCALELLRNCPLVSPE